MTVAAATAALAAGAFVGTGSPASAGSISGSLYVDGNSGPARWANANSGDSRANAIRTYIASQPMGKWFTSNNPSTTGSEARAYVDAANAAGKIPVAVLYVIPKRDCSQYSGGGATSVDNYRQVVDAFAGGLGSRTVIVILETDALALTTCLSSQELTDRNNMLKYAIQKIKSSNSQAKVYLDAGHSAWNPPADAARRLNDAGVQQSDGFFSNVSNFRTTADEINFGKQVLAQLNNGNLHQIIDTSRNGNGAYNNPGDSEAWCNPPGRKIGQYPTLNTGESTVDAFLWVKIPGESDGSCKGYPSAGTFSIDYAYGLLQGVNPPQQTWEPTTTTTTTTTTTSTSQPPTDTWTPPTTTKKPPKTVKYKTVKKCRVGKNGKQTCKWITKKKNAVDPAAAVAKGSCTAATTVSAWPGGYAATVTVTASKALSSWSVTSGSAKAAGGALAAGASTSVTLVGLATP
ncbi:MAG: glycoside hydrolase family 6 protein [Kineosporiaceae bacterium]